jgi:hydrogenase expression/formation protein HypC
VTRLHVLDAARLRPENPGSPREGGSDVRRSKAGQLMCLAVPGQVLGFVDELNRLARVEVAGVQRNVNVGLLDGPDAPRVGDWVLIHVGFALSKVDEEEAQAMLRLLEQMGEAYEQELEDLKTSVIE